MYCCQCEQTRRSELSAGCAEAKGVCGKDEVTADLQDLLIYQLKGLGELSERLHQCSAPDQAADRFILYALFTTLTNVNFNRQAFTQLISEAAAQQIRLREALQSASGSLEGLSAAASFKPAADLPGLLAQATLASTKAGIETVGEDVVGLRALTLYGLKGVAAYAHHAAVLGESRSEIAQGVAHALAFLAHDPSDAGTLLNEALALGKLNYLVMQTLDSANTANFGVPSPTTVRVTPVKGKAILVSGHDLRDLHAILQATQDKGIQVYTHGELLPAHGYPELKAYAHLAGNYGSAWQKQQQEFAAFPGPIVMTSNCLIEPQPAYRNRIFTVGPTGWPGVRHIDNHDYTQVIQAALALPGFSETAPEKTILVGFGHDAVLGVADKVIAAVNSGAIRHFFLIGGCDGAAPGRNYYSDFADHAPKDTLLLTLGCGKYRFNMNDYGSVAGLPRLLDMGQCNDSYAAIKVALALADAFKCGVNDLPLSLIISWFEQKAVAVLLTLLALGVRNIRLGPSLPAFLTPALLNVLVQQFAVQAIGDAEADIQASLARQSA